jgi:hypothetical protein
MSEFVPTFLMGVSCGVWITTMLVVLLGRKED